MRVVVVARCAPPKRFDLFLETARALQGRPFRFFWIGNRTPVPDLPANVQCLGEMPAARRFLRNFHLLMLPSDYEGMPMVIIEAMAAGLPVVASAVGGIPEVMHPSYGEAVTNDPSSMASAIERLCASSAYAAASQAARAAYLERFSGAKMWKAYEQLYRECIA